MAREWQWGDEGSALIECEKAQTWKNSGAASFSAHVRTRAEELNVDQSALWRAISAVRFYQFLKPSFEGYKIPPLKLLQQKSSSEIVELIERHSRILPKSKTLELVKLAFEGEISRRSLQESWKAYAPILSSNRRGRRPAGQDVEFKPAQAQTTGSAFEADVSVALSRAPIDWLGTQPFIAKRFLAPRIKMPSDEGWIRPDLVFVVQETEASDAFLHGFEVKSGLSTNILHQIEEYARSFDFFWVVAPPQSSKHVERLPAHVGLLSVDNQSIRNIRPAKLMTANAKRSGRLSTNLLASLSST